MFLHVLVYCLDRIVDAAGGGQLRLAQIGHVRNHLLNGVREVGKVDLREPFAHQWREEQFFLGSKNAVLDIVPTEKEKPCEYRDLPWIKSDGSGKETERI